MLLLIAISSVIILWWIYQNIKSTGLPPGCFSKIKWPWQFPILGSIPQLMLANPVIYVAMDKLSKKFGHIMSLQMGSQQTVVISSYEATKELFGITQFEDRPMLGSWSDRQFADRKLGILFSDGKAYRENFKFSQQILRQHGFGNKETHQTLILAEVSELVDLLTKLITGSNPRDFQGHRIHFHNYFTKGFLNLISSLVTGERLPLDNPDLELLTNASYKFLQVGHLGPGIMTAWPWLRFVFPELLGYNLQMEAFQEKRNFAKKLLDKRKKIGLYRTNSNCFTDTFLQKMEQAAGDSDTPFTEKQFSVIFSDFIIGGSYTQDSFMAFAVLLLASHPKVQEKVYKEIVSVLGKDGWSDTSLKSRMPYTQAVMTEIHRWARIGVLIPRLVSKDVFYGGFKIQKGTYAVANLHSIFFEKDYWEDPENFRPERYFDSDGELLKDKLQRVTQLMFGTGKRRCLGEILAQDATFLYFSTIFQRFYFQIPEGEIPSLEPLLGVALRPKPFDAIAFLRN